MTSAKRSRDLTVGGVDLGAAVTAKADLGIKGWVWTTVGSYRVVDKPDYAMDLFAGARLLNLSEDLKWSLTGDLGDPPIIDRTGKSSVSDNIWDGVIGVKGRATFGDEKKWFVPYYIDVGTGDSDLTWLGMLGAGYSFEWGEVSGCGATWTTRCRPRIRSRTCTSTVPPSASRSTSERGTESGSGPKSGSPSAAPVGATFLPARP